MKEIEVLVKCDNTKEEIIKKLKDVKYISEKKVIDTYYYDELRENLKPNTALRLKECLRIRETENKSEIAYKVDHFTDNDIWLYSDEEETEVISSSKMKKIIELLGLKELIKIDNTKTKYENEQYKIFVEEVKELGVFFEVEKIVTDDIEEDQVESVKDEIREYISSLGLINVHELNEGKPEMMLKKKLDKTTNL